MTTQFEMPRLNFPLRNIAVGMVLAGKSHTETGIDDGQKRFLRMNAASRSTILTGGSEFGGRKTLDITINTFQKLIA